MAARFRNFVFTDFECDEAFWQDLFDSGKLRGVLFGKETCPETGRDHFQGKVLFKNAMTESACRKLLRPRHVEVTRSDKAADEYCRKDGDVVEIGDVSEPKTKKLKTEEAVREIFASGGRVSDVADQVKFR